MRNGPLSSRVIVRGPRVRRRLGGVVIVALGALGLSACHPKEPHVDITGLYPVFQKTVVDYVNRCDPETPTQVHIETPDGTTVSVDGAPAQGGDFTTQVSQQVGERFTLVVTTVDGTRTHHIRCLPTDFPNFSSVKSGVPQAEFYSTPLIAGGAAGNYSAVFDTNGVPVWWLDPQPTFLLTPLANKNFAIVESTPGGGMEEYDLSGNLVRSLTTVAGPVDFHDVLLLPSGNYVLVTVQQEPCDLTAWGRSAAETCVNHVVEELDPSGAVVWEWDTAAHIPITETPTFWRDNHDTVPPNVYDPWHYNSIEFTGDGYIISFRHLNAVYKIDRATGDIIWKLGGVPRPSGERLEFVGDPLNNIGGQHDARLLPDGSVTIYDNGASHGRPPREVRYVVDVNAGTATLVEDVRDTISNSFCCGSARRLPTGNWVAGWGGNFQITENAPDGSRVFLLTVGFVYRGIPIPPGVFTTDEFRAGMDAMFAGGP